MTKNFIQNVSMAAIKTGDHADPGENSMLIQIVDPAYEFPTPKHKFREVHQFEFLDLEASGLTNNGSGMYDDMAEFAITQDIAHELVHLLQYALDQEMNVIVHCHAGRCRSGGVCEVGTMMGFAEVPNTIRQPNALVKSLMMKSLGWTYE